MANLPLVANGDRFIHPGPNICLTSEKRHRNLRQGSRIVLNTSRCVDLAVLLRQPRLVIGPPYLPVGDLSQPLAGTSAFPVTELRVPRTN
jgi:hypothetical protein